MFIQADVFSKLYVKSLKSDSHLPKKFVILAWLKAL